MKEHRAGHEILGRRTGEIVRIERALGQCLIARGLHEVSELFVRDLVAIDPQAIHANLVNWPLLGVEVFGLAGKLRG